MSTPAASIIIVSRERPKALARCLLGVSQLNHPDFEVIVVADVAGLDVVADLPFSAQIKTAFFDEANISQARNLGLAMAAGEIVAFIDDDAVPEPSWLMRLTEPFGDPNVAAAGGYVRGRNGISFQWRASSVDTAGRTRPLRVPSRNPMVFSPPECQAVKTEGTNCAFRRDILMKMGGFDPVFAFYLDETDVNMRLAIAGRSTAIVPLAQVHHGYLPSKRRNSERVPKSLFDIGRSIALFHRKYADQVDAQMAWRVERIEQRKRLLRFMQSGALEPSDVLGLMRSLEAGHQSGSNAKLISLPELPTNGAVFEKFMQTPYNHHVLSGRIWQRKRLRKQAKILVSAKNRVTLVVLSPTSLFHRITFTEDGFWEQNGGIFGKSNRNQPYFQIYGFRSRVRDEVARSNQFRAF
ncbi:glycosyltransferase family 2 protein [Falsihalocynthiibacter sp. S25ZX9]|uniref:glycosyltransferase family 2 protein n=1 Tax=Falsihalocynthiibacter sp. S25ZX9 TaxID=3240870 RepID=UPI00351035D1